MNNYERNSYNKNTNNHYTHKYTMKEWMMLIPIFSCCSRILMIRKLENDKMLKTLLKELLICYLLYKDVTKSITSYNNTEFAGYQFTAKKLQTQFYFVHLYASWERGLNEYSNKLVRQYVSHTI